MKFAKGNTAVILLVYSIVHSFAVTVHSDEYLSCSQILEDNICFKKLPENEQILFLGIVDEVTGSSDVQVSFNNMSGHRKNEFVIMLKSWCENSVRSNVDIDISKKELGRLIVQYLCLPVFVVSTQDKQILFEQKEQLENALLSHYEKHDISSPKQELIKSVIKGLTSFFENRMSNDVTPSMKYSLSSDDFNNLLKSLPERIDKIDFEGIKGDDDVRLKIEIMKLGAFVEQAYYQAIPKKVIDDISIIQGKFEKFLLSEDAQKKAVEKQLAENMKEIEEFQKKFYEEVKRKTDMIAQEEGWEQLRNNQPVEVTVAKFSIFRIILVAIGIVMILFACLREFVNYRSRNNNLRK
jgi:hypothetical protein